MALGVQQDVLRLQVPGFKNMVVDVVPARLLFGASRIVHKRALPDQSSPVHDVKGVEVTKGTGYFSSVEPGSGLQEDPLPLEMIEQLERREKQHVINTDSEKL